MSKSLVAESKMLVTQMQLKFPNVRAHSLGLTFTFYLCRCGWQAVSIATLIMLNGLKGVKDQILRELLCPKLTEDFKYFLRIFSTYTGT